MATRKKPPKSQPARAETHSARSYVEESARPGLSILIILPLVILYQIGIVQAGSGVRNIAEIWMTGPLGRMGMHAATVVNLLVLAGLGYGLYDSHKRGSFYLGFMGIMLMESLLYALLLFTGVSVAAQALDRAMHQYLAIFRGASGNALFLAVGAGVYEELLFRLVLVGGGALVLRKIFLWSKGWSCVIMLLVSALLFSAVHHIGPCGEAFTSFAFIFRTLCGLALGVLFLARGLGIAVWTHALYNILVLAAT